MVAVHFFEMHKGWFASEMNSSYSLVDRTKPKRNANIELLRCILMFLIVFHHASFWGCWKGDCSQHLLIFLGTLAVMWHVDAFVAISGWFGVRFTWRKFFALWSQVAFYSILSILCVWHSGGQLNLKALSVNGGWFASAYFLLMLISPVLNAGVEGLVAKGKEAVISSWKILAIGIVLSSCPIFLITGVGCGASEAISVSLLVFVYASSRLARLTEARVKWKMIFLLMFSYLLLVGVGYMSIVYIFGSEQAFRWCIPRMVAYNLPWVWVLGISVVVFFAQNVHVSGFVARAACLCAPSMFAVYLLHHTTSFGPSLFVVPERLLAERTSIPPIVIVFLSSVFCFVACILIDLIRRLVFFWIGRTLHYSFFSKDREGCDAEHR